MISFYIHKKTSSDTTVADTSTEQPSTTATSGAATLEGNLKLTMHSSWIDKWNKNEINELGLKMIHSTV